MWYNSRRVKRILRVLAIVLLTAIFLGFFLWKSNLRDVWAIIRTTSLFWLAVGLCVNSLTLVFRTFRWRTIIDADHPPPFYATYFANATGYMLSTILPIRAGDVARPALLARRSNVRFTTALGTVLTERVLDLFFILGLFVYFAVRHWNDFSSDPTTARYFFIIKTGAIGAAVLLSALFLFLIALYFFSSTVRRLHEMLGRLIPKRFREGWMSFFDAFVRTLDLTHQPLAFAKVLLCTIGIWGCLTSQFYFTMLAMHRTLPYDASFFVNGVTTVGLAIPTPGGVGGFHKACQLVLTSFYHFNVDDSVAVAIVYHVVGTLPVIVVGLSLFLSEGLNWRQLRAQTERVSDETTA